MDFQQRSYTWKVQDALALPSSTAERGAKGKEGKMTGWEELKVEESILRIITLSRIVCPYKNIRAKLAHHQDMPGNYV